MCVCGGVWLVMVCSVIGVDIFFFFLLQLDYSTNNNRIEIKQRDRRNTTEPNGK